MGWGGAGKRCCFVAFEKLMNASNHRDAAPWASHLGNFISFWRVTSLLRVKSDKDETAWGRHLGNCGHFWSLVSSPPGRHAHCRRQGRPQACTWSCFRRMRRCGRDGTVKLAVFVLVQALGRWQRMPGPPYLRHFVMECSGRDRCGGKVRWKEVESEVESSGGWNIDWRVEWRVHCRVEW